MWNLTIIYRGEVKDIGTYRSYGRVADVMLSDLWPKYDAMKISQFTITRVESDSESEPDDD